MKKYVRVILKGCLDDCPNNPRNEVKEIKPEKAGELWRNEYSGRHYHTEYYNGELMWVGYEELLTVEGINLPDRMTRLYPPVEDDSVERIEIKKITFGRIQGANGAEYMSIISTSCGAPSLDIFKGKSGKMIFEIPKDKP